MHFLHCMSLRNDMHEQIVRVTELQAIKNPISMKRKNDLSGQPQ